MTTMMSPRFGAQQPAAKLSTGRNNQPAVSRPAWSDCLFPLVHLLGFQDGPAKERQLAIAKR
jgi:hypothetical protein